MVITPGDGAGARAFNKDGMEFVMIRPAGGALTGQVAMTRWGTSGS